jgi:hypothetical protein
MEQILETMRDDARAYAALASAIAFAEVVLERRDAARPTDALPRPTLGVVPPRETP